MKDSNIKILKLDTAVADYSAALCRLYQIAGWESKPDCVTAYQFHTAHAHKALEHSYCCFGAFDTDIMVGFFRALSDGVSDAYLLDLIVDPKYRKLGIGSELCSQIVQYLKDKKIEWITAISTPEAYSLYSKIGAQMKNHTPFRF